MLVPIPQMAHLSLNTDTFGVSGQSTTVLVSCTPLLASWEPPSSRPRGRQTGLCEEVRRGVLTLLYCVRLARCFPEVEVEEPVMNQQKDFMVS